MTVVRFMIGQFALINFFATGTMKNQLTDLLSATVQQDSAEESRI